MKINKNQIEIDEEEDALWGYEDEDEDIEPDGYECMACGNIQNTGNGFGCDKCSGPMKEWYC